MTRAAAPLRPLLAGVAALPLLIVYCQLHAGSGGPAVGFGRSALWAFSTLLPWTALAAAVVHQRARLASLPIRALVGVVLVGALLAAIVGYAIGTAQGLGDWLVDRIPAMLAATGSAVVYVRTRLTPKAASDPLFRLPGAPPLVKAEIRLIRSAGNYVELHSGDRSVLARAPLGAVADTLVGDGFLRVHRTAVVNMRWVDALVSGRDGRRALRMRDGTLVPVGRIFRDSALQPSSLQTVVRP